MHTAQLLSQALDLARHVGYQIRQEALEGAGGGHFLMRGEKWLLIDLTQTQPEQLKDVVDALRSEPNLVLSEVPAELVDYLQVRRAA